jgi:hypothetical protein
VFQLWSRLWYLSAVSIAQREHHKGRHCGAFKNAMSHVVAKRFVTPMDRRRSVDSKASLVYSFSRHINGRFVDCRIIEADRNSGLFHKDQPDPSSHLTRFRILEMSSAPHCIQRAAHIASPCYRQLVSIRPLLLDLTCRFCIERHAWEPAFYAALFMFLRLTLSHSIPPMHTCTLAAYYM